MLLKWSIHFLIVLNVPVYTHMFSSTKMGKYLNGLGIQMKGDCRHIPVHSCWSPFGESGRTYSCLFSPRNFKKKKSRFTFIWCTWRVNTGLKNTYIITNCLGITWQFQYTLANPGYSQQQKKQNIPNSFPHERTCMDMYVWMKHLSVLADFTKTIFAGVHGCNF